MDIMTNEGRQTLIRYIGTFMATFLICLLIWTFYPPENTDVLVLKYIWLVRSVIILGIIISFGMIINHKITKFVDSKEEKI